MRIVDFSNEMLVEIFSYVGNPPILRQINHDMKMVVDKHCNLLYRPIYLQILECEGIDLVTFERERGIDTQLPFDLKVKKAWRILNLYRKHAGLPPVLFQQKADDMAQLYQKGHLELQSALTSSRVSFWIALGGAAALEEYTPNELGCELRKWMHENCDPKAQSITLFQNICPCFPPEMAFFCSLKVIRIHGMISQEIVNQLRTFRQQGILPWATRLERVEFEAMKMIHNFTL